MERDGGVRGALARDEPAPGVYPRGGSAMSLVVGGRCVVTADGIPPGVQPSNLACALAVADRARSGGQTRVAATPSQHRRSVADRFAQGTSPSGVVVVDDTFNSNPAGARAALEGLRRRSRRRVAAWW